jgi:hypothetical protein
MDDDDDDAAGGQAATNLEDMHTKARAIAETNFFTAPSKTPRRKWPGACDRGRGCLALSSVGCVHT